MGSWVHGFMSSWVHGFMGSWVHGFMGSWVHGFMGSWVARQLSAPKGLHRVAGGERSAAPGCGDHEIPKPRRGDIEDGRVLYRPSGALVFLRAVNRGLRAERLPPATLSSPSGATSPKSARKPEAVHVYGRVHVTEQPPSPSLRPLTPGSWLLAPDSWLLSPDKISP
jgi:hypothetical protein